MSWAIRRLSLAVSRYCGAQRLFRLWSKGPTVLFYHGVEKKILDPAVQGLHIPLRLFERQIAFLRRHREIISMDYLYESILNRYELDPRQVILTFDDGYKNNLHIVGPLLKAWALPFVVFISTRHISESRRFPTYYIRTAILHTEKKSVYLRSMNKGFYLATREKRLAAAHTIIQVAKRAPLELVEQIQADCMSQLTSEKWAELNARFSSDEPMSWEDATQITSMGATIGSHCHDHCILHVGQREEEVHRQLAKSKAAIEAHFPECKYLAYPNGTVTDISNVAYSAAKSRQFRMAFSTILGEVTLDSDCFLAPRISADREYEEFCYLLNRTGRQNQVYQLVQSEFLQQNRACGRERAQAV
jgi:peptidoglycan/xylan/chitin deacetylase (PgdA/CDA1 family)